MICDDASHTSEQLFGPERFCYVVVRTEIQGSNDILLKYFSRYDNDRHVLPERVVSHFGYQLISGNIRKHQVQQHDVERLEVFYGCLCITAVVNGNNVVAGAPQNKLEHVTDMLVVLDDKRPVRAYVLSSCHH